MRLARLSALVLLASCGDTFSVGFGSAGGTYKLVTVDGHSLPASTGASITVRGTLDLKNDARFALTQTDSIPGTANTTTTSGHWSVDNNAVQLVEDAGTLQLGILFGDSVRVDYRSHANVYFKQ